MTLMPIMDLDLRNKPLPFEPSYILPRNNVNTRKNYFTSTSYYHDYSSTPTLVENNSGIFYNTNCEQAKNSKLAHTKLFRSV